MSAHLQGSRPVRRDLAATPGVPLRAVVGGLPTGPAILTLEAYAAPCDRLAGQIATWSSDRLPVVIDPVIAVQVAVVMRRNGRIELRIDWEDDPDGGSGPPDGGAPDADGGVPPGGDNTAPVLLSLAIGRPSIDVTSTAQALEFPLRVRDEVAGFLRAWVVLRGPSRGQEQYGYVDSPSAAGTTSVVALATIPRHSEPGTWTMEYVQLMDRVFNHRNIYAAELQAMGIPTTIQVIDGDPDLEPPSLDALALGPVNDPATGQSLVTATATITDGLSGFTRGHITFRGVGVEQHFGCSLDPVAGGPSRCADRPPPGTWTVSEIHLRDAVNNVALINAAALAARGLPTVMRVPGVADTTAPTLTGFAFTPTTVDVRGGAGVVAFSFSITEAGGLNHVSVHLNSPGGQRQSCSAVGTPAAADPAALTATCTISFVAAGVDAGLWRVGSVFLLDRAGNQRNIATAALEALGFPTALTVAAAAAP